MRRLRLIVSLLILLSVFGTMSSAKTKDVFVLVDVSGTMNNNSVNQEAKQIICEYLMGNRSLDSWESTGWKKVKKWDSSIPNSCIEEYSYLCLIPFGDIDRKDNWNDYEVHNMEDMKKWIDRVYPTNFKDKYTFLELARAYVGAIGLTRGVEEAYVIIYTDGQAESTNQQYNNDDQQRIEDLHSAGEYGMKLLGTLRNSNNPRHYDIEIWKYKKYETIKIETDRPVVNKRDSIVPSLATPLKITKPNNEGLNEKHSISIKQEVPFNIGWNKSGANVVIYQKKEGSWSRISGNNIRNFYTISKQANSAKITFLESGDYKIMVRSEHGSDERYVSVSSIPWKLFLPILLTLLAVVGAVFAYQRLFKKADSWDDHDGGRKPNNSMNNNCNDDW